jgi:hypothetical protein
MILVDTSVIADILTKDRDWFQWSSEQLEAWGIRAQFVTMKWFSPSWR